MMKKKELEILLERVEDIKYPDADSEQYSTPATVASELLFFAFANSDIEDRVVYDLGCGNGILGIGAKLLGAREVIGIDRDRDAIEVARRNSKELEVELEFRECDLREVVGRVDTVVMNPPFGAQRKNRHADRVFLKKSFEIAAVVYTILNAGSESFVRRLLPSQSTKIYRFPVIFPLKWRFWFHKSDIKPISADIYRVEI